MTSTGPSRDRTIGLGVARVEMVGGGGWGMRSGGSRGRWVHPQRDGWRNGEAKSYGKYIYQRRARRVS